MIKLVSTDNSFPIRNKRQSTSHIEKANTSTIKPRKEDFQSKITFDDLTLNNKTSFNISGKDLLILLHIQKTGGTTFERHLVYDLEIEHRCSCVQDRRRCYCPRFLKKQQNLTRTIADSTWLISRFSTGWVCGLHPDWTHLTRCVQGLDRLFFVTFLRDPLHRFISEFRHVQRGATWKDSKSYCEQFDTQLCYQNQPDWLNVSLEEFMNCPFNMAINRQTRMLADYKHMKCNGNYFTSIRDDESMLISAMNNLEKIPFFGLCEEQTASQLVFERTFDLKFKDTFRQSSDNKTKILIDELPNTAIEKILELNHLDVRLYSYAIRLFRQRCQRLGVECNENS